MTARGSAIATLLRDYPRVDLTVHPTPIHKLPNLSSYLGHEIYILREDLTGFALGGNKVRKLDFLVGDAIAKGATTLVTRGASSFSRNAAAAGRVHGLEVHVVIEGKASEHNHASRRLFAQLEATLHYVTDAGPRAVQTISEELVEELRGQGKVVYELHPGGSDEVGALGYLRVFDQIVRHTESTGIHFGKILLATGSTATQVGLVLGQAITGYDTQIVGIAISQKSAIQRERVLELARTTARMLGVEFDESSVVTDDRFFGEGYAIASEAGTNAAKLFAKLEGVLLDPVYTAKAAAALIEYGRSEPPEPDGNLLFIHTGGNAGLFY